MSNTISLATGILLLKYLILFYLICFSTFTSSWLTLEISGLKIQKVVDFGIILHGDVLWMKITNTSVILKREDVVESLFASLIETGTPEAAACFLQHYWAESNYRLKGGRLV